MGLLKSNSKFSWNLNFSLERLCTLSSSELATKKFWKRHCLKGSLAGAARYVNDNHRVQSGAHSERKSEFDQKGKSTIDLYFQEEYWPWNRGLSILVRIIHQCTRCPKSYHRDNWLVATKSSDRRRFLILRCRLFLSFKSRILKGCDCSPLKKERELGLDRRETG